MLSHGLGKRVLIVATIVGMMALARAGLTAAQPSDPAPLTATVLIPPGMSFSLTRAGGAITIVNQSEIALRVGPPSVVLLAPPGFAIRIVELSGPGAEACRQLVTTRAPIVSSVVCDAAPAGDIRLVLTVPSEAVPLVAGCSEMPPLRFGYGDLASLAEFISPGEALEAIWLGEVILGTLPGGGHVSSLRWTVYSPRADAPAGAALSGPAPPGGFRGAMFICMAAPGTLTRPAP